jgi:hypothetical protein
LIEQREAPSAMPRRRLGSVLGLRCGNRLRCGGDSFLTDDNLAGAPLK